MRAFIAVDIVHPKIAEVIREISGTGAAIKFVEPENTHITLKFLGGIDEAMVEKLGGKIKDVCSTQEALTAQLCGVGVFPSLNYMRVLWIGFICPGLVVLQRRLDCALVEFGFKREKNFKAHLTIGRVKTGKNKSTLASCIEQLKNLEIGTVVVDSVKLKSSVLMPKGPTYSDMMVASL